MSWAAWLSLASICALGAMSPGPSLAVVLRHALGGGVAGGLVTAWAHAVGVGQYALAVALGLAVVVTGSPALFQGLQLAGAAFLAWLGLQALRSGGGGGFANARGEASTLRKAALDGFLIAFLNPKIALWFLALFSQFVAPDSSLLLKVGMAGLALAIDGVWYSLITLALSHGRVLDWLRRRAVWIDRIFGLLLLLLALRVAWGALTGG